MAKSMYKCPFWSTLYVGATRAPPAPFSEKTSYLGSFVLGLFFLRKISPWEAGRSPEWQKWVFLAWFFSNYWAKMVPNLRGLRRIHDVTQKYRFLAFGELLVTSFCRPPTLNLEKSASLGRSSSKLFFNLSARSCSSLVLRMAKMRFFGPVFF